MLIESKILDIYEKKIKKEFEYLNMEIVECVGSFEIKEKNFDVYDYIEFDNDYSFCYELENEKDFKNFLVVVVEDERLIYLILDENYEEVMYLTIDMVDMLEYL